MNASELVDVLASVRHAMEFLQSTREGSGSLSSPLSGSEYRESMRGSLAKLLRRVVDAAPPRSGELKALAAANPEPVDVFDRSFESYTAAVFRLSADAMRTFHAAYAPSSAFDQSEFDCEGFTAWYSAAERKFRGTVVLPDFRDIEWIQVRIRKERKRARLNISPLTSPLTLVQFKDRHPLLPAVKTMTNVFRQDPDSPQPVETKAVNQTPKFSYSDLRQFAATRWPEALSQ